MDYFEIVSSLCSPTSAEEVRVLELRTEVGGGELRKILYDASLSAPCKSAVIAHVSTQIITASPFSSGLYFNQAASLTDVHTEDTLARISLAAQSIRVQEFPDLARAYFTALKVNNIDITDFLLETFQPNWGFSDYRDPTWQYHLYLAHMETPKALSDLARKISITQNGNDVTNFLHSIASLTSVEARDILMQYQGDVRTADGVDGPGLTIGEFVNLHLDNTNWK